MKLIPLGVAVLTIALAGCDMTNHSPVTGTETAMNGQNITSLVRDGREADARSLAAKMGPDAITLLKPLLGDPDPEVRALAMTTMGAADPAGASDRAVDMLNDPDENVVASALRVLNAHPPEGRGVDLIMAMAQMPEPIDRAEVALIAGRLAPDIEPAHWRLRRPDEDDPEAELALCMALARMGDEEARTDFTERLRSAHEREAYDLIQDCAYFEDPWPVPTLRELLSRTDVAIYLAPDMKDTLPFRVCDAALEMIVQLLGADVPFDVPRPTQYTTGEIDQVRKLAGQN
jgi:hypothetical protein